MPTQSPRRRVRDEVVALAGFPPEGLREPFKPEETIIWTERFPMGTGGENFTDSPDAVQPDQATQIENMHILDTYLRTGYGYSSVSDPRASATAILCVTNYEALAGTSYLIRIDRTKLQFYDGTSWTTRSHVTADMTGADTDKIRAAMVLNQLVFVNGVNEIMTWSGGATYSNLSADANRPATARFVVAFADRAVFADLETGTSRNTQRVEWSENGDIDDFTASGAGGVTLFDTSGESGADDIMGLFSLDDFLIVPRRRSIWIGQRTGQINTPIVFQAGAQGYGCIAPDSGQVCGRTGFAFLGDDNVYLYHPVSHDVLPIGNPIKDRIRSFLDTTKLVRVWSAYVPERQQYWLFLPDTTNAYPRRAFVFEVSRLITENKYVWYEYTTATDIYSASSGQTTGLGSSRSLRPKRLVFGDSAGDVFAVNPGDAAADGASHPGLFISPEFNAGTEFVQLARVNIAYSATTTGNTLDIEYSVDGGTTWTVVIDDLSVDDTDGAVREASAWVPSGAYGKSIRIRVRSGGDQVDLRLYGYRIGYIKRGEIRT